MFSDDSDNESFGTAIQDDDNESVCTAIQGDNNESVCTFIQVEHAPRLAPPPSIQVDREPRSVQFSDRKRGPSPVPPPLFRNIALQLVSKLWGQRLAMLIEPQERQSIFEEVHRSLTSDQHLLLCAISWQFNSRDPNLWEFYQFTFHPDLELGRDIIFRKVRDTLNDASEQKMKVDEVSKSWDTLIKWIGDEIKARLVAKQYPLCTCAIVQPHSFNSLESCIQSLKEFDSSKIAELTRSAVVGHTSLRVLDMMNESNEQSLQHPPLQQCHDVFNNFLGQLKNRKDPVIKEILVYEENQQLKKDMDSIAETLVGIRV